MILPSSLKDLRVEYPIVPLGAILSQDPGPGLSVAKGTIVNYVVSKGSQPTDTLVPTGPLEGVNELIVGGGRVTVNEDELLAEPPGVVTEIGPVVAPPGTWAVMSVDELTTKLGSAVPLNVTLVAPVKLLPWMSTLVPTGPLVGANELSLGAGVVTVNCAVALPSGVVMLIGPLVASAGTVRWRVESDSTVNDAGLPPIVTNVGSLRLPP